MTEKNAYIAITICSIIIGFSFMFVKVTLKVATPLDTLAHRFTIAWIVATGLWLFNKELIKATKKDVLAIVFLAIFYPILFFTFQVFGLVYTTSSEAGIIQAVIPIFTLIFSSLILKEKSNSPQKIAITLSVLGVIYIMYMKGMGDKHSNLLGSGFILLSALSTSLYSVFNRKVIKRFSLFTNTYFIILFAFIAFNVLALTDHLLNGTVNEYYQPFHHIEFVFAILYLSILSSLGTSYLTNYALSKLPAFQVSVFGNVATLITILAGIVFLNESFHYYHLIGSCFIIGGVFGVNYFGERNYQSGKENKEKNNSLEVE